MNLSKTQFGKLKRISGSKVELSPGALAFSVSLRWAFARHSLRVRADQRWNKGDAIRSALAKWRGTFLVQPANSIGML